MIFAQAIRQYSATLLLSALLLVPQFGHSEELETVLAKRWTVKCASIYNKQAKEVNADLQDYALRVIGRELRVLRQKHPAFVKKIMQTALNKDLLFKCQTTPAPAKAELPENTTQYIPATKFSSDKMQIQLYGFRFLMQIPADYFSRLIQKKFEESLFAEFLKFSEAGEIPVEPEPTPVNICSSNVQFLGGSKLRDNKAMTNIYKDKKCDIVVIQELIAPPDLTLLPGNKFFGAKIPPTFADGAPLVPNEKNTEFFLAMQAAGFDQFWLSEEDTGNSEKNHSNGTNTEWFVVFYKSQIVKPSLNIPNGFLDLDRTHNVNWDRVPYAFSFSTVADDFDFVLISVHLHPGPGTADRGRRKVELGAIFNWIDAQKIKSAEKDFVVLGDMNLEDQKELLAVLPTDFKSLNVDAKTNTNTNFNSPKPYDHVMMSNEFTKEVGQENNFEVINLINEFVDDWAIEHPGLAYPGQPYNHDLFRFYYSDHHPVMFKAKSLGRDDD